MPPLIIGSEAIDRSTYTVVTSATFVYNDNPANAPGKINTLEMWAWNNMAGVKVGSFYPDGTNKWCNRDYVTIGNVTSGSKQTFSGLEFDVLTGDCIGIYIQTGRLERDSNIADGWYVIGDKFGAGTFTAAATNGPGSLRGLGETLFKPKIIMF